MGEKPSIVEEMRLWEEKQLNQNKKCTESKSEIPSAYNSPTLDFHSKTYETISKSKTPEITEYFYQTIVDNPIEGILILEFNGISDGGNLPIWWVFYRISRFHNQSSSRGELIPLQRL